MRVLTIETDLQILSCSCHFFSRFGLPCRHMLLLMGRHEEYHVDFCWWRMNGISFSGELSNKINDIVSKCQEENPSLQHGIAWKRNDSRNIVFPYFLNDPKDMEFYIHNLPGSEVQFWNYDNDNIDKNIEINNENASEIIHEIHEGGSQLSQHSIMFNNS